MSIEQSELERLRKQVAQLNDQLMHSEKLASLGQLAAGVAHEINNPIGYVASNLSALNEYINSLMMLIKQLGKELPIEKTNRLKQAHDFDYINKDLPILLSQSESGLKRVIEIVHDLKDFSYLDDAEFEEADIHLGIQSTLNILGNELKYKAKVNTSFADLPLVRCIASQINQVVLNLILNAVQEIEHNGEITITTGYDDMWVWFSIEDNGPGIEQSILELIFQPFFTTKEKHKGTGLGLALSRSIIDKHQGVIEVKSKLGSGSCFTVKLPISIKTEKR
ncbi:ATP-binding protein [Pseudoalteromonas sp. S983]|jgi:two-component system NtrC family sensor kinase|uniref:sensor histidine kinase n=1 Tax=Pseudoalteromonas sp. S983 TaxID=579572 RepID=UPI00110AE8CA|nr:ATP-binding protein [Pseudoalteromonas sp. S983]TMP85101.1 ATPase [Pseudoalteromonas sp. S983]USN27033.1 ATPase [synthetic construct]